VTSGAARVPLREALNAEALPVNNEDDRDEIVRWTGRIDAFGSWLGFGQSRIVTP
jgi:hypothetical protein